jgi:hypothetical protein
MSADPKLRELRPEFRAQIAAILDQLEAEGFQPKISNALRTAQQQLDKVAAGYAMPGATSPGTHGWGLACDIIDRRWGWKVCDDAARFFARLCDLATAAGLTSGGAWFGRGGTRKAPTHRSPWNRWGLGWDVAHVGWESAPAELRRPYTPDPAA